MNRKEGFGGVRSLRRESKKGGKKISAPPDLKKAEDRPGCRSINGRSEVNEGKKKNITVLRGEGKGKGGNSLARTRNREGAYGAAEKERGIKGNREELHLLYREGGGRRRSVILRLGTSRRGIIRKL